MNKFNAFFMRAVSTMERDLAPNSTYFLLFLAILGIRLFLEFFSNQRLFRWEDAVHIGLWFTLIVQVFVVLLQYFSAEHMTKVMRTVVCSFSIALTAPIIDLIISQGHHSRMNYLTANSFSDILFSYFTIGGASLTRGATLGIRIEIVLLIIASFNYIRIKRGNIFRAFLGTLVIYTFLFISGLVPHIIILLNSLFALQFQADDLSTINFLICLNFPLFVWINWKLTSKSPWRFKSSWLGVLQVIGWSTLVIIGCFQARIQYPLNWNLNPSTVFHFPFIGFVILLMLFWNENLTNLKQRPSIFLVALFTCTLVCGFPVFFMSLVIWACSFVLNHEPLHFRRIKILNSFFLAIQNGAFLLLGFVLFGAPMIGINTFLLITVLIISFSIYLLIDILLNRAAHETKT